MVVVDYKAKAKVGGGVDRKKAKAGARKNFREAFEPPPALDKANALFSVLKESEF